MIITFIQCLLNARHCSKHFCVFTHLIVTNNYSFTIPHFTDEKTMALKSLSTNTVKTWPQ